MVTWVTSDPHFGHAKVAELRGFDCVEDHDALLMDNYRRAFKSDDVVWWLGDIAFNGWLPRIHTTVGRLPGTHHLVLGNHDRAHPLQSRGHEYQRAFMDVFASVSTMARASHGGRKVLLSHFPYEGDTHGSRGSDRCVEWRPFDAGIPLIHGHTHGAEKVTRTSCLTAQLHVGLDAWGLKPVLLSDAISLLETEGAWA